MLHVAIDRVEPPRIAGNLAVFGAAALVWAVLRLGGGVRLGAAVCGIAAGVVLGFNLALVVAEANSRSRPQSSSSSRWVCWRGRRGGFLPRLASQTVATSNPDVRYTAPGPPYLEPIIDALNDPMRVSYP